MVIHAPQGVLEKPRLRVHALPHVDCRPSIRKGDGVNRNIGLVQVPELRRLKLGGEQGDRMLNEQDKRSANRMFHWDKVGGVVEQDRERTASPGRRMRRLRDKP